jgi:hypothetical protein
MPPASIVGVEVRMKCSRYPAVSRTYWTLRHNGRVISSANLPLKLFVACVPGRMISSFGPFQFVTFQVLGPGVKRISRLGCPRCNGRVISFANLPLKLFVAFVPARKLKALGLGAKVSQRRDALSVDSECGSEIDCSRHPAVS